jgi:hypothetical protein
MRKFVIAALALAAGGAFAQSQMKPGLWEITQQMKTASGQMEQQMAQMQQQMANMPPERRKMVEQMMAQRGVKMDPAGGNGMTMKICMTKEMIERNQMPQQQRGNCKTTLQPRVGSTTKMSFTCTNPQSSGEGEYTLTSADSYHMKMVVNTTMQGKPETMNMEGSGKWLGADCGDVKPIRPPAAK